MIGQNFLLSLTVACSARKKAGQSAPSKLACYSQRPPMVEDDVEPLSTNNSTFIFLDVLRSCRLASLRGFPQINQIIIRVLAGKNQVSTLRDIHEIDVPKEYGSALQQLPLRTS